jgi:hypothetical protein
MALPDAGRVVVGLAVAHQDKFARAPREPAIRAQPVSGGSPLRPAGADGSEVDAGQSRQSRSSW